MDRLLCLLSVVLAIIKCYSVSGDVVIYSVTFVSCVQGSTCPQGNPTSFNQAFALNDTIGLNLTLDVGDQLQLNLLTDVPIHPLTICQNSPLPQFCQGAADNNLLNTPITQAGSSTSATFTMAGTYYYGCMNHPGMGATISVIQTNSDTSTSTSSTAAMSNTTQGADSTASTSTMTQTTTSTSTIGNGTGHRLSTSFLFVTIIALMGIIFN